MTLSTALILSLAYLCTVFAAPTPQDMQQVACQVEKYTVEKTEKVAGKPFMSTSTCSRSECGIVRDAWTVVPLVSQNLVNERFNDEQYNQIAIDAYTVGNIQAAPGQQEGDRPALTCPANSCGLIVTPQYVHITGTRTFTANCAPAEPFEMWLAQTDGNSAMIETTVCSKDTSDSLQVCPSGEAWVDQVVPSDLPAGTFAKISYREPHGSGIRYRVRFNKGNPNFTNAGEGPGLLFLGKLNDVVFNDGPMSATAHAHNWQEYMDGTSEIADFDFDPKGGQPQSDISTDRIPFSNAGVCNLVADVVNSTSGLRSANAGVGICENSS